jgi:hypothetical protein
MLKVFSSNVISEAVLVQSALIRHGIAATTQNEYSGRSAIPEFRPEAEIWITHDSDYESARKLVVETLSTLDSKTDGPQWACSSCATENPASFELCWNCGKDRASPSPLQTGGTV